jgi:hypothetical protein
MAMLTSIPSWEYQDIALPRGTSREAARQLLTGAADTGRWELATSRVYPDGRRAVTLRRRVYRVTRAD